MGGSTSDPSVKVAEYYVYPTYMLRICYVYPTYILRISTVYLPCIYRK